MYAIKSPFGYICEITIALTKTESIQKALRDRGYSSTKWRWMYEEGYRAVKVEIIESKELKDE